jgi:hypothetical protein
VNILFAHCNFAKLHLYFVTALVMCMVKYVAQCPFMIDGQYVCWVFNVLLRYILG